jgi:hypothetical protein
MGEINELFKPLAEQRAAPIIGRLVDIDEQGRALVDFKGNPAGPLLAATVVTLPPSQATPGRRLLLVFEDNDLNSPVIVGIVGEALVPKADQSVTLPVGVPEGAIIDGKKIRFDAKEEIQLVCGKSSILLRKDGKVVVKGRNILNRAQETNKIKGGNISLN